MLFFLKFMFVLSNSLSSTMLTWQLFEYVLRKTLTPYSVGLENIKS